MKQILLFATLIFGAFAMHAIDEAEYETYRITWSEISALVENNPDSIKSLIDRAALGDTTLRTKELLVAYMGKSFFGASPFSESRDARSALNEDNIDSAMVLIEQAIKRNPLSLSNNYYYVVCALTQNPQIADYQPMQQDEPYKVTCVDDEYTFMSQGLDLPRPTNQSLTKDGHDMFKLPAHSSTLYTGQEIHFDATRILQLEQNLFNPN